MYCCLARGVAPAIQLQLLNAYIALALLASSLLPSMSLALVSYVLFRRRDALFRSCRHLLSAPPLPKSGATLYCAQAYWPAPSAVEKDVSGSS